MTGFNDFGNQEKAWRLGCITEHGRTNNFAPPPEFVKVKKPGAPSGSYCSPECAFKEECQEIYGQIVAAVGAGQPEHFSLTQSVRFARQDYKGSGIKEILAAMGAK